MRNQSADSSAELRETTTNIRGNCHEHKSLCACIVIQLCDRLTEHLTEALHCQFIATYDKSDFISENRIIILKKKLCEVSRKRTGTCFSLRFFNSEFRSFTAKSHTFIRLKA